jgi:hypothetical protein
MMAEGSGGSHLAMSMNDLEWDVVFQNGLHENARVTRNCRYHGKFHSTASALSETAFDNWSKSWEPLSPEAQWSNIPLVTTNTLR